MEAKTLLFLVTLLVAIFHCKSFSASAKSLKIHKNERNLKYFWYENDNGQIVQAFLEGSPKNITADERDIHFYLYTKSNPNTAQEIFTDNLASLTNSNFKFGAPVKVMSHGFSSSSIGGASGSVKDAYMSSFAGDVNVILIDWAKLAAAPWYDDAAANTRLVGQKTSRFLEFLVDNGATTVGNLHLMGHSLGSHVCGFAGSGLLVGKVPRITALDPALPLFGNVGDNDRIDPTDANFVDVIHTSGGPLTSGELAFMDPRGHLDFYPNGGKNQVGCTGLPEVVGACSHSRAYEYYSESLKNNNFRACQCQTWTDFSNCNCGNTANMGAYASTSARGYYYLTTNGASPYAKG